MSVERLDVKLDDSRYPILLGRGALNELGELLAEKTGNKQVLLVSDETFKNDFGRELTTILQEQEFDVTPYYMSAGKISKTFNEVLKIYGILETGKFARDSTLIALGGGVIGDLAGFVASTWYRGMNLIHMPSTLMGMVDSSVGGKVAINFRETINAVGNYYHPLINLMDLNLIDNLPDRDYVAGLAEVIKCALIADPDMLIYLEDNIEAILARDEEKLKRCIFSALQIKIEHVNGDLREGGKRLFLNYGHTLGHAIETATHTTDGESLRHGEGVALGICAVLSLSEDVFHFESARVERIVSLLDKMNLPTQLKASGFGKSANELIESCYQLAHKDKKRANNSLRFILLKEIGEPEVVSNVSSDLIYKALERVIYE